MYHVEWYPMDSVPQSIYETIESDIKAIDSDETQEIARTVYFEQLRAIDAGIDNSYFFAAYNGDVYLGGVGLYLDCSQDITYYLDAPCPGIQGIARSQAQDPVKINSLLIPAIKDFLIVNGFNVLYVNPYRKQKDLLLKYYGFQYPDSKEIHRRGTNLIKLTF